LGSEEFLLGGAGEGILLVETQNMDTVRVVIDDVGVGQRDRTFLPLFFSTSAAPALISHELARGNSSGGKVELAGITPFPKRN